MDNLIRKVITIGLPALMLFIATAATGKTGDDAVWSGLRKVGVSLGRKSLLADVAVQGKIISMVVAHPSVPTREYSFVDRNKQFAAIGEYAAQVKNPVVVVGDLNTTMWSPFYKSMVKTARLRNARSGFGILPTWPTFMPPVSYLVIQLLLLGFVPPKMPSASPIG
ncbi:MAG: hypothetical protein P2A85_26070 [Microcoleus anatoxicus]|uniref:endonuclease/exonuclease/phosphatase family protein n=1 Tax=Microcoleus anatoxicus TaxID=2705319 RepID=UPI0036726312